MQKQPQQKTKQTTNQPTQKSKKQTSTKTIEFFVEARPVPKVRTTRRGTWSPAFKRCQDFERFVKKTAKKAVKKQAFDQSRKWILHLAFTVPELRGDPDNLIKSVIDALRGVLFDDDSVRYIRKVSATFYKDKSTQGIYVRAYQEEGEEEATSTKQKRRSK
ncbi:MAG: RusA family crossover junction endodeoxyribonuclease [Terriglobia bacterium]